jgi:hypothetical protein
MTTIAARASTGEIAADSMVSGDDSFYLVEKLRKGQESIYGGCGDWDIREYHHSCEDKERLLGNWNWGKLCYRCHALRLESGRSSKAGVSVRHILP